MLKYNVLRELAMTAVAVIPLLFSPETAGAQTVSPVFPGASWQTATPAEAGFDSNKLTAAMTNLKGNVLVVRNGYQVAYKGSVSRPVPVYSVSKSVTSMLFATLVQSGTASYDAAVPGSAATWRQFLNMTSNYGLSPDTPGTHAAYNNAAVHYYGEQMRSRYFAGKTPEEVVQVQLRSRVGGEDPVGFRGYWGGWNGGGLSMSVRDMARLGLLILNRGKWSGVQVVPGAYVDALYTTQVSAGMAKNHHHGPNTVYNQIGSTDKLPGSYSFGWWTNDNNLQPELPSDVIWARGLHGNYILISPSHNLVVVKHGESAADDQSAQDVLGPIIDALGGPSGSQADAVGPATVSGELRKWHNVTLTFDGPSASESATPNPFLDYRLNVTFRNGTKSWTVPGYFAADGDAGDTGATSGNKWRVHFVPDLEGTWQYSVSFRKGAAVAISADPSAGAAVAPNGVTGSFVVSSSNKSGRDFRGKGFLRYSGKRYLQFSGTGELFVKGGANSPENLLAYSDFDATTPKHYYNPHSAHWKSGDPLWKGSKGRNLIGAMNYLAGKGMNSVYFLTMNVNGDGKDVWPWTSSSVRDRYDVSKLAQWDVVFSHMDKLGLAMHLLPQERENDQLLDGGALGTQRKLYYRELIARFGHHPALVWNLGEENTNSDSQRKQFADYIRDNDPWDHPIIVHTYPSELDLVYTPLLGFDAVEAASLQIGNPSNTAAETRKWLSRSAQAGRPWVVSVDEIGPASVGVAPDSADPNHDSVRKQVLWPALLNGAAGVEWYFGYSYPHNDLNLEDFGSRSRMWDQTRYALDFMRQIPFERMQAAPHLTSSTSDQCFALPGEVYAVYLPNGGSTTLDLGASAVTYTVRWFNPRTGGSLLTGSVASVTGPGAESIGQPPSQTSSDWVALISASGTTSPGTLYSLTVNHGTGSGRYAAGTTVNVAASAPPAGQSFAEWMGAAEYLSNSYSAATTLRMPAANIAVSATYAAGSTSGGLAVTGLTLINADTDQPIPGFNPIPNGATLNLATLPTLRVNVRANTNPATVGSVQFSLNGTVFRTESSAPYALAGDSAGQYDAWTPALGSLSVSATPFTGSGATGTRGTPLTLNLTITKSTTSTVAPAPTAPAPTVPAPTVPTAPAPSTPTSGPSIAAMTLINADTNQPVSGYTAMSGQVRINRAQLGLRNWNIRATTNPSTAGSVVFRLNGSIFRTESAAPFAMGGDTSGEYWPLGLSAGTYTVTATAYTSTGGGGTAGTPYSVILIVE